MKINNVKNLLRFLSRKSMVEASDAMTYRDRIVLSCPRIEQPPSDEEVAYSDGAVDHFDEEKRVEFFTQDLEDAYLLPVTAEKNGAHLVSSLQKDGKQRPVIDIDVPMHVEKSPSGNHHLYFDVPMTYGQYMGILKALNRAGVVEKGIVNQLKYRKMTTVRLPGVAKVVRQDPFGKCELLVKEGSWEPDA